MTTFLQSKYGYDAYRIGRDGRDSPWQIYLKKDGKWITPYERKVRRAQLKIDDAWLMTLVLRYIYRNEDLAAIVFRENPWLKMIPVETAYVYVSPPVRALIKYVEGGEG